MIYSRINTASAALSDAVFAETKGGNAGYLEEVKCLARKGQVSCLTRKGHEVGEAYLKLDNTSIALNIRFIILFV